MKKICTNDKIIYKGLGHKLAFKHYSLITHYENGECKILKISKAVFNELESLGYPVEC